MRRIALLRAVLGILLIAAMSASTLQAQKASPSKSKATTATEKQSNDGAAQNPDAVQLVDPRAAVKGGPKTPTADPAQPLAAPGELLPVTFGGWQRTEVRSGKDPAQPDAAHGALLKEYGFTDYQQATYTLDGRKMEVKAARFADASGAYGAFTFYKQPEMLLETIGDQGAQSNELVLFYRGNVFVQAHLDRVTEMTAAQLRELAAELPQAQGQTLNLPVLPTYLPKQSYVKNSAKYVVGPVGFGLIALSLPVELVGFDRGAEVVTGKYDTSNGTSELVLISYPTPQIAAERMRAIDAYASATQRNTNAAPGFTQMVRRSGPIVVFVGGQISVNEAKSLLGSVNYDANVTWNEPTFLGKRNNIANLVVAAMMLAGVILLFALAAGIAFGTIRIVMKKYFPDRVFDRSVDVEIIRLDLSK